MKDLHEDNMFGSVCDRLRGYKEAPSEELWGRIAGHKDMQREAPLWPLWLESSSLGAVAVILLIGIGTLGNGIVLKEEFVQEEETITNKHLENQTLKHESVPAFESIPSTEILTITQDIVATQTSDSRLQASNVQPPIPISNTQLPTQKDSTQIETPKPVTVIPPYKKTKSKFQLFLSITPSLSFQKIIPAHDNLIVEGFEHRSPLSSKRFGFAIDAGFQRNINNVFGYYGGVTFYHQQQELTYRYFDRDADVNRVGDSWTFEINRPQHTRTFNYNMTNIGLRSGILITLKGEKLQHKFGAGLIYSHGIIKGVDSYNNSKSSYLSYQLFYRNEVKINEHVSWFVEPTFIYGFLSKEKLEEPFKLKPYRAGIGAGVLYRF